MQLTINDPCDWWFYFEKINEGEMARCKNCNNNLQRADFHGKPHFFPGAENA